MNDDVPPAEGAAGSRPYTIEQILAGIAMGLIVLITFGNVLVRYLTSRSFAATEEFSIALMIVLSFLGSSVAFAFDRHIRVDFFTGRLPQRVRVFLEWLSFAVTASLFAFIAFYAGKLTWDQYRFEETSPALGVPQWWYTVWMPVLAVALVLRLAHTRLRRRA
ncbi:TRAP transporter small permease [Pseudothauera rhizosphaerae]|uniref:TRAP transporter small permease protein n=1 Tax=Pseudothauera rhizosphaerae TaxID=2565932 RepID=A0A4S4AS48_9RHOO|nr:TRAP transporter small permease [Pseudothauera rhizosphaerae]THF62008.1 TRAP transporter small permease [Pseudothauera rhizosphaerae]